MDNTRQAFAVLDGYVESGRDDQTRKVLGTFLEHLPRGGQRILAREISSAAGNNEVLKKLGHFLSDAILKPGI